MKKKLCFVLDQFLYGGIERVAINYLDTIDKNKYDIDVVILSDIEDMVKQIPKECNIIKINIPRYHNPLSRASTMVRRNAGAVIYYITYLLKKIFIYPYDYIKTSILRKKTYDVAIAFSGHLNDCYIVLDCMKANKKLVWAHGMIYQYLLMSPAFEKMYSKFDKIVSINHIDQNDIFYCKPYLKYNIVNLYNPIKIENIKNNKNKDEYIKKKYGEYILSVARLDYPKDFITLINAFDILVKEKNFNYNLVIVGDGPDRKKINDYIESKELSKRIFLVGAQDNVSQFYENSKLFAFSSLSEGLPTVIIEAMSKGIPVVATDSPYGCKDIIGTDKYGLIVSVGDFKEMANKIKELLFNKDMYDYYSNQSLKRYNDFLPENIIKSFYEIIGDKNG